MAQTSTLYRFQLELADIDRGVYETLDLRVACHPSEDDERMVVRVLARAIAHEDGLDFGRGLSNVEDPALCTRTPTGDIVTWIDVGVPSADRLHRASKATNKVLVFTHKPDPALRKEWGARSVHRSEAVEIVRLPPQLVQTLAAQLDRNERWYVTIQDGALSVARGDDNYQGPLVRSSLAAFLAQGRTS